MFSIDLDFETFDPVSLNPLDCGSFYQSVVIEANDLGLSFVPMLRQCK